MLFAEALLSVLLVAIYWESYPRGFAQVAAMLAALLVACGFLVRSIGARVVLHPQHRKRAMAGLGLAAAVGCWSLVLGLLAGPHLAAFCVWGVLAQVLALTVTRLACAT